jgi:hypothetical protein
LLYIVPGFSSFPIRLQVNFSYLSENAVLESTLSATLFGGRCAPLA